MRSLLSFSLLPVHWISSLSNWILLFVAVSESREVTPLLAPRVENCCRERLPLALSTDYAWRDLCVLSIEHLAQEQRFRLEASLLSASITSIDSVTAEDTLECALRWIPPRSDAQSPTCCKQNKRNLLFDSVTSLPIVATGTTKYSRKTPPDAFSADPSKSAREGQSAGR